MIVGSDGCEVRPRRDEHDAVDDAIRSSVEDLRGGRFVVTDAGWWVFGIPRRRSVGRITDEVHEPGQPGHRFAEQPSEHLLTGHTVLPQPHRSGAVGAPVVRGGRPPLVLPVDRLRPSDHHVARDGHQRQVEDRSVEILERRIGGHVAHELVESGVVEHAQLGHDRGVGERAEELRVVVAEEFR